ncbi:MAG TPA: cell division protein FtsZ [bacterium]|nr:cell division protein FtsZ [bacterium]
MTGILNSMVVKIGVVGVGGGGCNAVDMMCDERDRINSGADGRNYSVFNNVLIIAANTDVQALEGNKAAEKLQLGPNLTKGQGAGGVPEIGKKAAEESKVDIATVIDGLDMLFITAGMGGGTGTGAAAVVAEVAKNSGILTVGIVTKPFDFEAKRKQRYAMEGMDALRQQVDTLVVIPNQRLLDIAEDSDMAIDMFKKPNEVLIYAVRNLSELITNKSFINVDFADVRQTMTNMGLAMFGFGSATGENAAINAVKEALNNPLLADFTISGSKKMLVHFGGAPTPMKEFASAAKYLTDQLHEDGDVIWGASVDEKADKVYALIVAEATEDTISTIDLPKSMKKVEASDQGKLFEVNEKPVEVQEQRSDFVEMDEIEVDVLAPAAQNTGSRDNDEEVFNIDREKISATNVFDDEIIVTESKYNPEDTTIPAYLRYLNRNKQNEQAVTEKKLDRIQSSKNK